MNNRYDDLVLHLKLDDIDISTSMLSDSSKSGLKAKVHGASLVEDDTFGACLNFQGQDDHVEVSSVNLTGPNPPHTIGGWIKMETYPQARAWILLLGQEGTDSHHWLLNSETAGDLGKKAQLGAWGKMGNQATPIMPVAEWVHVATTYDGSNFVCYLNGQPVDTKKTTFNLTDKAPLTLAKRAIATEKNFQGKMAHVRIYRRALSQAEIREDMDTDRDDLVLHLNLDDIDISTNRTPDSSKSGLKAKVNGASLVEDDTFGACLNFERQDDHVEISSLDLTGANPPHTIEGWIKVQAYPEKAKSFILLLGQADEHSHHWLLNSETAGDLGKKAQLGHWGLESRAHAKPIIPLAEWVHLATTFDGLNYVCYLNGQAIDKHEHYKFTLTDKRLTLAESANLRESARVRGIATEKNFQGKMAHVRIYRRALSEAEIRNDMDTDRLALAAFRRGHPIGFSLSDKDENYVLYIGDDPRDHHHLNLELRNTSAQAISFQKQGDTASRDNHHFELVFRNGVLSDKTLKKLRENKEDVIVSQDAKGQWDLFCPPREDSQTGTVSVSFLYKDTSKRFGPNESLIIPLRNISANAGSGARGTRVELKLNQLTYDGETTPITGSRIQHLQIISHLGSRRVPLHVGFVGSNRILNDGSSANTLVLQLMNVLKSNVLKSEGDTSVTLTKDSEFRISFDVQSSTEVAPWSLCKEGEIEGLKANDSIIVAQTDYSRNVVFHPNGNPVSNAIGWKVTRTDHGLGQSPVWSIAPKLDIVLQHDDYIQIYISNIKTSLPSGLTNLYLDYKNIDGFWDGQVVCPIEKAALLFYDVKDKQGNYTRELRVGIGCVKPVAKLEIAVADNDADTKSLVIRKDSAHYLTVLHDGKVGIGKALPEAPLDVNGEIRANFFRAGEGRSRRLPIGSTALNGDAYWYRIAKIASPKPYQAAGAEFSLRAIVAGKTVQVLTFRLIGFTGVPLGRKPQTRFVILSNTGSFVFSKLRFVLPPQTGATSEGYLDIFTRHPSDGEADVSFAIYDNLDIAAWQPVAWEKQATTISGDSKACEHSLDRLFMVADTSERLAVDTRGAVLINGQVSIGTSASGAALSLPAGLHVGGNSDPGDKNLLVEGKASIKGGLHVGAPLDGHEGFSVDRSLLVNGSGIFLDSLIVRNSIGLLHLGTQNFAAEIKVEPALVFKTHHDGKWHDSMTVHPPGGEIPTLIVAGNISEKLDLIELKGRGDWTAPDHPIMKYFSRRLTGKPVGTMLRAITDLPEWRSHYWQGWVDADQNIRVIFFNTPNVVPKSTGAPGIVVRAD